MTGNQPQTTGAAPPSVAEVTLRLKAVMDPELGDNIVDLGMAAVESISAEGVVAIAMKLTIKGCPLRVQIKKDIESRLETHPGVSKVTIDWGEMTADERTAVMTRARWNAREQARVVSARVQSLSTWQQHLQVLATPLVYSTPTFGVFQFHACLESLIALRLVALTASKSHA
jgi:metal-sulfur cluster biosynthetic enzyme